MINTVEQDQVAVWSGSVVFKPKSSYMINTVEQDQGCKCDQGLTVFITKLSYMINTVEQDQVAVIRVCSVYNKVIRDLQYDQGLTLKNKVK